MFEPWIGKHYRDTGLLLLGESSYSWEVDGRKVSPSPQHPQDLVHDIVANFKHQGLGFMRTLTRGLTNDESPSALVHELRIRGCRRWPQAAANGRTMGNRQDRVSSAA